MKNLIKDIIFVVIFIILFNLCSNIFVLKGNGYGSDITSFYNQAKNSLDVVFFGSSHSYSAYSPDIIEDITGFKSYNFATQQQPIHITYHYMIETLKTQHPKYFVLESYMLTIDEDYASEGTNRDAIDKMNMSFNKINTINESVFDKDERISYYFNIIKYHSRYNKLTKNDIVEGILQKGINNRGFINLDQNSEIIIDNTDILRIKEELKISNHNLEYLDKIIDLAKNENIKLILVVSPFKLNEDIEKKLNWLKTYALEKNIDLIDYNELSSELKIEVNDFYDYGHLSKSGALKVSEHFANYLKSL